MEEMDSCCGALEPDEYKMQRFPYKVYVICSKRAAASNRGRSCPEEIFIYRNCHLRECERLCSRRPTMSTALTEALLHTRFYAVKRTS